MRAMLKCERANVGVMFALSLVPAGLIVGAGLEYSRAGSYKQALQGAVDQSALVAARAASNQATGGSSNWVALAQAAGQSAFAPASANLATKGVQATTPTINVAQAGGAYVAQASASATVPVYFMQLAGFPALQINASSTASVGGASYTDLHIVVDISASMGIGATAADQQTMSGAIGCSLACHASDVWGDTDTLAAARASGATLRIDAVKQALAASLQKLSGQANVSSVRVALYTLSNTLTTVLPLTNNISAAISALSSIDLTNQVGQGGKNITYALQQLNGLIATPGNGQSPSSPSGVVILATDAAQDSNQWAYSNGPGSPMTVIADPNFVTYSPFQDFPGYSGDPILEAIDPAACAALKGRGLTVMTLYMQYIVPTVQPDASDPRYAYVNSTLAPVFQSNMSACATSPALALSVSSPTSISSGLASLIALATPLALRLTQ